MKWIAVALTLGSALFLSYILASRPAPSNQNKGDEASLDYKFDATTLRAAADKEIITPDHQVPMAGFSPKRLSLGVNDDLYARCLIIETAGGEKIAFVSLDLIGFIRYDVLLVREELRKKGIMDPDCLIICSTHTHAGPDMIGMWGRSAFPFAPNIGGSGRDEEYIRSVREKIVDLVERTAKKLEPARLSTIEASGEGYSKNVHLPRAISESPASGQLDVSLVALIVQGENGTIATLTNFAVHPETFRPDNQLLSSDFPGELTKCMEKEFGGTALFVNGLLGAMVTCRTNLVFKCKKNPTAADRAYALGNGLTQRLVAAKPAMKSLDITGGIRLRRQTIKVPLDNFLFQEGMKLGIIPHNKQVLTENREVLTEVGILDLGNLRILMIPGEIQPGLGLKIKKLTGATMDFGLTNDEVGYILPTEDFSRMIINDEGQSEYMYNYERTMSLGPLCGDRVYEGFEELLKK